MTGIACPKDEHSHGHSRLFRSGMLPAALAALLALAGCANVQQAINGYEAAALVSIKAAEDNNIRLWSANACGTPLSAAIRNPQIVPALRALCLPAGADSNPAALLEIAK